jgi:peptidyl-prolyl cis-trans isomerase SurA
MMKLYARALLALVLAVPLLPLSARAAPEAIDGIVAVVNDGVILDSELDNAIHVTVGQLRDRGITPPAVDALKSQVLERLILNRLQTQRAQQAGIRIEDRDLNEVMVRIAQQNNMTPTEFVQSVKREGLDYGAVREQVRDEMLIQQLRQKEVSPRVVVTEQDVNLYLAKEAPGGDAEYRLSHILVAVPDGATPEVREKARQKAEDLLKRLRGGADFAQIAISDSDGQQALQGGDLDWRKGSNLPTAFANVAPRLELGQISSVIEAANGYNIIKLTDKREAGERKSVEETRARHILLTANKIRDAAATRALALDLYDRLKKGEDFAELARKYSDDPGSKNSGGDLGWQPPGVFAPEFQTHIDALRAGELAAPFTTQFGWHIARVEERRTRDVTQEMRHNQARNAIAQRKEAEEYDVWLRRLREEAYVEYRMNSDSGDSSKTS